MTKIEKNGIDAKLIVKQVMRNSNIELLRIVAMLSIVAHHYVTANALKADSYPSGLLDCF